MARMKAGAGKASAAQGLQRRFPPVCICARPLTQSSPVCVRKVQLISEMPIRKIDNHTVVSRTNHSCYIQNSAFVPFKFGVHPPFGKTAMCGDDIGPSFCQTGAMRSTNDEATVRLYYLGHGPEGGSAETLFYGPLSRAIEIAAEQPEAVQAGLFLATDNDVVAYLDLIGD
ncbi:MAG: hypothetical protein RIS85_1695 [Pseudomonadota bacterium]